MIYGLVGIIVQSLFEKSPGLRLQSLFLVCPAGEVIELGSFRIFIDEGFIGENGIVGHAGL